MRAVMEDRGRHGDHGHIDQAGEAQGDQNLGIGKSQHPMALAIVVNRHPVLGQARMKINRVRHHRRADYANGERDAMRTCQPRYDGMKGEGAPIGGAMANSMR